MATFDGPNKIITLNDPGVEPTQSVPDVYSEWKIWTQLSDNLKFLPAFDLSVGGNPTNPPEKLDGYYFVRNDLGWRVKPFEAAGVTTLAGNLFAFAAGTPLYISTTGAFNTFVIGSVSSKALALETGTSGLTGPESAQLLLISELLEADHFFDQSAGLLHYYRRGTTTDLITPKVVVTSQTQDTSLLEP